jgi:hypothetical protein
MAEGFLRELPATDEFLGQRVTYVCFEDRPVIKRFF